MNTRKALLVVAVCGVLGAAPAAWFLSRPAPIATVPFAADPVENAALSEEFSERVAHLNADQRASVEAWAAPQIKLALARMYGWFELTQYDSDEMRPFLVKLETFPLARASLPPGADLVTAQFGADIALQAATIGAARFVVPEVDRRRMGACAVRAASTPEDDVIRMRAAMLLRTLRDAHPGGKLMADESRTLSNLMSNDWIRDMVERNWRGIEDLAAGRSISTSR